MAVMLEELTVADAPREGASGLVGWSLRGLASTDLDGLPTNRSENRTQLSPVSGDNCVGALCRARHPGGRESVI